MLCFIIYLLYKSNKTLYLLFVALVCRETFLQISHLCQMWICTKKKSIKCVCCVWLARILPLLLDVAIISLPRSISRPAACSVCACVRACAGVYLRLGLGTSSCFSRNETAPANLNTCFCFWKFSIRYTSSLLALQLCIWFPLGSCSISAHACPRSGLFAAMCMCVCVCVGMMRARVCDIISFCIESAIDSQAADISSSLQSHTVFHSINFCPPPWAHFTGVNSSPPLGWVCAPAWICRAGHSLSLLIEPKSEMF